MKRNAFTLVELLVVIAIIAVLVAILVPVIGNALAQARQTACLTNLKTIGQAFKEYSNKNGGQFARVHTDGAAALNTTTYTKAATEAAITATPMNQVWKLMNAGQLPATAFKCGGDGGNNGWQARVEDTANPHGWGSNREFSYGIQAPFDTKGGAGSNKANPAIAYETDAATPLALKPTGVLMADMLTRTATAVVTGPAGYQNHGSGLAYVTQAGNAIFHQPATPNSIINGDEIYADSANAVVTTAAVALPGNSNDAVILGN